MVMTGMTIATGLTWLRTRIRVTVNERVQVGGQGC